MQQVGSIMDYQAKFEKLLAKVGHLGYKRQVSCFINGLEKPIRIDVQANKSLTSAIGLARLYEARDLSWKRFTPTQSKVAAPS